jgi:hypothetical protein
MVHPINQRKATIAFYFRILIVSLFAVVLFGGYAQALGTAHAGLFAPHFESSLNFETLSATPTAFPDEMRFAIIAHALDCTDEDGGIRFNGLGFGNLFIYNGGIFSNACITAGGGIYVIIWPPPSGAYFVTEYQAYGGSGIDPVPEPFPSPIDISFLGIPQPDCSLMQWRGTHFGGGRIFPGVYESITLKEGTLKMMPGLYCVRSDVDFIGGEVFGDGITFYVEGNFTTTSSVQVSLRAPQKRVPPRLGITDVLLYLGEGSQATLYNQGEESFSGVVYAPGSSGEILLSGYGTITTQLVAHTVRHATNGNINLVLDPLHSYPKELLSTR